MRTPFTHAAALLLASIPVTVAAQPRPGATEPPRLAAPTPLTLPDMQERTLPNGLKLVVVPHRELPIVNATLVIRSGSEADPAGKNGLATLTANLLDEGAAGRDALGIAEQVAYLAIRLGTFATFDQSQVSLHTTRATLDSALKLMADVVLRPTFAQKEFDRLKSERMTALLQERDRGPAIADRVFASIVFGEQHPYGHSTSGTTETTERLGRDDVVSFWRTHYRPNNATLVVAGDITVDEAERYASQLFGAWERGTIPTATARTPAAPSATTIYLVDKPGAPQTSFRIGGIGVARSTTDYYPLLVANTALGGSFTSRLNQNLRETKGYTYGASSSFAMRREPGAFTARAEVVREKTDSALIEFMKELNGIRTAMPAEELEKTKQYLQLGYAGRFETPGDIAGQVSSLVPYSLPLSTLGNYDRGIGAVSAADVRRVATRYLDPSKLAIVVVGDRQAIEGPLKALRIAPVEIRDLTGKRVVVP